MSVRTFIAVETSDAVRARALALIERLRAADANVGWVSPEAMHITLKFLGEVDLTDTADICRAVDQAVRGRTPFETAIEGAGAFPTVARPRTVWLGAGEGADELVALSGAVEAALQPLGFKPERRTFTPHLTLGRVRGAKNAAALGELVTAAADFAAGAIHVDEVIVFSSRLERDGPVYEPLGRVPLEG